MPTISAIPDEDCTARSSVGRWIIWFALHGTDGLKILKPGRIPTSS